MPKGLPYYDEDPLKYVAHYYKRAKRFTEGLAPRLKEQWDMYLALDEYIEERRNMNRSALSFPLIFAHIEARLATLLDILNQSENFIRFEPIVPGDPMAERAAQRLESAFSNIRADLDWDEKFTEMFLANEIFDWNWVALETQTIPIRPETGVLIQQGMIGTDKTYPSFGLYAPGRVFIDGMYEREEQIQHKFKAQWVGYHQLKALYPDRVDTWLQQSARPRGAEESDGLFAANDWKTGAGRRGMATIYDELNGSYDDSSAEGFLLVEAHLKASYSDGSTRDRVMIFLPEVTSNGQSRSFPDGYPLDEYAKPFVDVEEQIFMTRGRPLPYTLRGKGTSDLLVPFQRDFSEQISTERDLDRLFQAPPMALRAEYYIGKEKPTMDPYEIWNFRDTAETRNIPISHFASPIVTPTPNRQWAMATNNKLQQLMMLVSAAVEAETGGVDVNPNKTATAFSGRARAANRRLMVPFRQQARTIQRVIRSMLAMMKEAPSQFLYPHIRAVTDQQGPAVLLPSDVMAAVHVRVPSLTQYANRELQKIMWRMVAEGIAQFPVTAGSPSTQIMLIENLLRSMEIGEYKVQEFKARMASDLMLANEQAQAYMALQVMQSGKPPAPQGTSEGRMGPGAVTHISNLTAQGVG